MIHLIDTAHERILNLHLHNLVLKYYPDKAAEYALRLMQELRADRVMVTAR